MYVIPGVDDGPAKLVWLSRTASTRPCSWRSGRRAGRRPSDIARPVGPGRGDHRSRPEALTPGAPMIPLRDANPTRRTPVVTIGLVIACFVGLRLGARAAGQRRRGGAGGVHHEWGVVPADLTAAWASGDYLTHETVTLITSQFLHGGWLHLLGNLLFLWIFGNNIEDRFGRLGFLRFYLARRGVAGLAQVAMDPTSTVPMIGASGAIAATLGAYFVLFPRARITSLVFLGFFYQLIDVPAIIVLGFWFVLQLIDGLASLGVGRTEGGVAFFAHIGGFVFGARRWPRLADAPAADGLRRSAGPARPWDNPPMDDALVEMVVESVRVHMLSSRHVVILKETDRDRYLPDLDRAVGGQRDRHAAPGPDPGATPDPRPVRDDPRGGRRAGRSRRHRRAGRRDVPCPAHPRARRPDGRGGRPAVRRAGAGGAGRRRDLRGPRCWIRPAWAASAASSTTRARRARPSRRPARRSSTRGSTCSATSSTRSTSTPRARAARASVRPRGRPTRRP